MSAEAIPGIGGLPSPEYYERLLDSSGRDVHRVVRLLEPVVAGGPIEVLYLGAHGPMTALFDVGELVPAYVREGW